MWKGLAEWYARQRWLRWTRPVWRALEVLDTIFGVVERVLPPPVRRVLWLALALSASSLGAIALKLVGIVTANYQTTLPVAFLAGFIVWAFSIAWKPTFLFRAGHESDREPRNGSRDIAIERYGIRWVRLRNGGTTMRCPEHPHVTLLFRRGSDHTGRKRIRPLSRDDHPIKSGRFGVGNGSLYCPEAQHDLVFQGANTLLKEAILEMEGLLDARVRERALEATRQTDN